jgi:hypothetical protein
MSGPTVDRCSSARSNTKGGARFWMEQQTFDYSGGSVLALAWHDMWLPTDVLS